MRMQQFVETPLSVSAEGETIEVRPGISFAGLARALEVRGVVSDARLLTWLARWDRAAEGIKAGEYLIEPGTRPRELLQKLVSGKVRLHALTLVEGWSFRQVMAALAADANLTHTLGGLSDAAVMERLGHPGEHPEGRFYPDTYHYPRGLTDTEFLRRAYDAMATRLAREWEGRAPGLPYRTAYEALIMASIVEKETGRADERPAIGGVFVRRLAKGMRLQTDPSVIYGLGDSFDGNLRRRHLEDDANSYNTYRHKGLPPTPIAMPGGDALHAALHPAEGDSLYFVSRGDGSHSFSATLEQHNQAVIRYQLNGKRRPFSSSPAP
jgi:UPF0755 protein